MSDTPPSAAPDALRIAVTRAIETQVEVNRIHREKVDVDFDVVREDVRAIGVRLKRIEDSRLREAGKAEGAAAASLAWRGNLVFFVQVIGGATTASAAAFGVWKLMALVFGTPLAAP